MSRQGSCLDGNTPEGTTAVRWALACLWLSLLDITIMLSEFGILGINPGSMTGIITSLIVICRKCPSDPKEADACAYKTGVVLGGISSMFFYISMIIMILLALHWGVLHRGATLGRITIATMAGLVVFKFVAATAFAVFAHKCRLAQPGAAL